VLFNSYEFLVFFLPTVLAGFFVLAGTRQHRLAGAWLTAASLFFYGWWNPIHVPLLMASMGFNYLVGRRLAHQPTKTLLIFGIAANILLLGYFKYTGFVAGSIDGAFGLGWTVPNIVLPLAISFFTFQQIAYLSDAYDGAAVEHDFMNYCLFITFFPHLIAGPITHHREMLPQFNDPEKFRIRLDNLSIGSTLFLMGLFKKVAIADPLGEHVRPIFSAAAEGASLTLFDAWGGALAYALQIYFDFSGYSDMAIGLGLMFGISLPPNFDSPFKARNIIEFWSRWHMTLTRFLTAYIYNPIVLRATRARMKAGAPLPRRGRTTPTAFAMLVAIPTILTMFISGVWHGAGWQFVVFGLLHGFYLTVNHGWRALKAHWGWRLDSENPFARGSAVLLTFVSVVVALVFFRADNVPSAINLLSGMMGVNGVAVHPTMLQLPGVRQLTELLGIPVSFAPYFNLRRVLPIVVFLAVVWTLPNTQQWLGHYRTALGYKAATGWLERLVPATAWRPTAVFGIVVGVFGVFALIRALSSAPTEFLYFQF
jgi:alginate O-acetyltransferase complex protein AlgI